MFFFLVIIVHFQLKQTALCAFKIYHSFFSYTHRCTRAIPLKPSQDHWILCSFNLFCGNQGSKWTAVAYILTGVIGAGVLSLSWTMAQLGWILGPICIILMAVMTLISAILLAYCYRHPNPEHRPIRNKAFTEAARLLLGEHIVPGVLRNHSQFTSCVSPTPPPIPPTTPQWRETVKRICISGKKQQLIIKVLVPLGLFGGGIAATITAAASVR